MDIRGIIFDINGTLIDILTDEGMEEIFRAISHFFTYQGIDLNRRQIKEQYEKIMEEQRVESGEAFPEFDAVTLWREFIRRHRRESWPFPAAKLAQMPLFLAEIYRGISRQRLRLYPEVREVLEELRERYQLAVVSDGQSAWAMPEMRATGIDIFFRPIVISGDYGFRKPDPRLFQKALVGMRLQPENVVFVGNDMYRDIYGASRLGMKTVFFSSNQGRKEMEGVAADYIIYQFAEIRQAIAFLRER